MSERAVYLQMIRENCSILFQEHAPIDVVTIHPDRIVVLSGTTGNILLSWDGTGPHHLARFVTETRCRLGKHLESGRYKGRADGDGNAARLERLEKALEEQRRVNRELVARLERQEKTLEEQKRRNEELVEKLEKLELKRVEALEMENANLRREKEDWVLELRTLRGEMAPVIAEFWKRGDVKRTDKWTPVW
jgi:hypothetical protein